MGGANRANQDEDGETTSKIGLTE